MKNKLKCLTAFTLLAIGFANAQVGVGTANPDPSAALDVSSSTKGLLLPRLTTEQRNNIASPAVGLTIYNITTNCLNFYTGSAWNESCGTALPPTVVSITGREWMDRNLGATQAGTSATDPLGYGDLYQWGRNADGHEKITWINSTTGVPVNGTTTIRPNARQANNGGLFITINTGNFDWSGASQNDDLWQGVAGVNNPCPAGFRLPTNTELTDEVMSYGITNATTAFASPLKFTVAGYRAHTNGDPDTEGSIGYYWTSSFSGTNATYRIFQQGSTSFENVFRANGFSVRCIKD